MLHEDTASDNRNLNLLNTRSLYTTVEQHHKNNPHVSMEAAFAYVMSNSSTFRALPAACIEKARRYLALPTVGIKPEQVTSECKPSLFFVTQNEITPIGWECDASPITVKFDVLMEGPDAIPLDGKQTVDHLVINTNNLDRKYNLTSSRGYVFNVVCGRLSLLKQVRMEDVIEARNRLGLSTALLESIGMPLYSVEFQEGGPQVKAKPTDRKESIKPGTTVVHAERVVVDNKKMIVILEFENVKELIDLPTDYYMSTFPYYFRSHLVYLRVCTSKGIERSFAKGDIVSIENFDQMIKTMKEAGVRLSKINKTLKLEKEHSGKFTVSI